MDAYKVEYKEAFKNEVKMFDEKLIKTTLFACKNLRDFDEVRNVLLNELIKRKKNINNDK